MTIACIALVTALRRTHMFLFYSVLAPFNPARQFPVKRKEFPDSREFIQQLDARTHSCSSVACAARGRRIRGMLDRAVQRKILPLRPFSDFWMSDSAFH